ncbi:MAG: hypothetical protein QM504_05835 [Pseudomonadota bacterium]
MSSITQIQSQQINSITNQLHKNTHADDGKKSTALNKNDAEPVLNKMSHRLNENASRREEEVSEQQAQNLIPDVGIEMMGVQSGNITAEFVANLLNKNPHDN